MSSPYNLHDTRRRLQDHIVEGEHGWVLQGVVSRASFDVPHPVVKQPSPHINNVFARKRGIARTVIQAVHALYDLSEY